jgi:flagellar assembly protein FliH
MAHEDSNAFDDAKLWDLPSVDDSEPQDDGRTDAFNKPVGKWKYEAPEQEEDLAPLTAEDIEAIRSAAYQDGLTAGHHEGFEKGHEHGLQIGKDEGLEQGKAEGLEKGESEAAEIASVHIQGISSVLEALQMPLNQLNEQVKQELVLLAVSLAKAVLRTEVNQSSESVSQAINDAIAVLPICDANYQIYLHPQDLENITDAMGADALNQKRWQLIASAELEQGGCKVLTQNNAVDMSISRRCEQIFSQLLVEQGLADDPRAS